MMMRKGILQVLGYIGSRHHQKSRDERKKLKSISQIEETTRNQIISQKCNERDKHLKCPSRKILGIILNVNEGRTSTNDPENNKTHDDA